MAMKATASARAPRGTKILTQAFFSAADEIPESSRGAVVKAALASIRDALKADREKARDAKTKAKAKAGKQAAKSEAAAKPAKKAAAARPAAKKAAKKAAPASKARKASTAKRSAPAKPTRKQEPVEQQNQEPAANESAAA